MLARIARLGIVLAWAILMGWLVRYEAFPQRFLHSLSGYKGLLDSDTLVMDSWMKIEFQDHPIGFSHTRIETDDEDASSQYVVQNDTQLRLNILGAQQDISIYASATLDGLYQLQKFMYQMITDNYQATFKGEREKGETFLVRIKTDAGMSWTRVDIPDDVILYSPMTELAMQKMKPGEELRVKTMDPVAMTHADLVIKAVEKTNFVHMDISTPATLFVMEYRGMSMKAWMSESGDMLRQETPFGWNMVASEPDEALAFLSEQGMKVDMLGSMAVPVKGRMGDPRAVTELVVRMSGAELDAFPSDSYRQHVTELGPGVYEIAIASTEGSANEKIDLSEDQRSRYLQSTLFVQSDHEEIRERAQKIVEGVPGEREKAYRIHDWVYRHIEKNPAASIPSALDVLKQREGDCNEHTYLYVALARAAGLPSRIMVGLLFMEGAFYYHAWPAVFVEGRWIELDPTLGQIEADATHLALLEGELANQMQLLSMIGRLEAEVVQVAHRTGDAND